MEIFSLLPLNSHETNDEAHDTLARHLSALKNALGNLDRYYGEVDARNPAPTHSSTAISSNHHLRSRKAQPTTKPSTQQSPSPQIYRIFPYPDAFSPRGPGNHQQVTFTYDKEMEGRKLLFMGKTVDGRICIKFTHRYGVDVHQWCADQGFAPRLIAHKMLPGGWLMVVMELLEEELWTTLFGSKRHQSGLKDGIHAAVVQLHQNKMVHGDLRNMNIMVKKDGTAGFMLVDYDWAGYEGKVKYPRHVNKAPELGWPQDVEDGAQILARHDLHMLEYMFRSL
jgi:hypothetical protein